ncbi:cryptochrome/photolyase family protein [Ollibium composti]|uniref:Cryptochrome/photolyase family protein n=1 Tax=Ollibium composti TaxID=2675109 RepID=A0ABY2Q3D3_9HYPH|nr:cryptochrome/photolyase family protein [Mesorhizobium composti]THF55555.1 cryptochrome/photolyase family protein [Mesorhizobium composti]
MKVAKAKTIVLILGDQLSHQISSLKGFDPREDLVLMVEVADETTYVRHHKQKIAFILSAMRHFADELCELGFRVEYVRLDDKANTGSFTGELMRAVARHKPDRVVVTEPGEWRVRKMMDCWPEQLELPVDVREDDRFFCSVGQFQAWANGRKTYRMEYFYREMRRRTGILMEGDNPCGGQWNFDADNRKKLPDTFKVPERFGSEPDAITQEILSMVAVRFADHFGDLEDFTWAVTRKHALATLDIFIAEALPFFGDYQDAMAVHEPFLFHALLSPYLNIGLLNPGEVCEAAENAFRRGDAPINSVEGFIRQILGWREYVRGIYWLKMPHYAETNALGAVRSLPWFYWSGETDMNCLATAIADTRRNAYAHHIQRLMITGNFALLIGVRPAELEEWYLAVYADAFDWVELPNTHGMVLFADGGLLASKPYAASGAYIDRMSDYCGTCAYNPKIKRGPGACPFNFLYWNFLIENRSYLERNPRMGMPYRTLDRMPKDRVKVITQDAHAFIEGL